MKFQNIMEKLIKCIPVFVIFIFGFAMQGELFHLTLGRTIFASYPASYCNIKESEFISFQNSIEQNAKATNVSYFFMSLENESRLAKKLIIYTDEDAVKQVLKKEKHIQEGFYQSLLSGVTEVVFLPLKDFSYDTLMLEPYLGMIGTEEARNSFYESLQSEYDISYPQIVESEETDMVVIVWSMVSMFLILINAGTILRNKKEILIRAVYGEDIVNITIRSMIEDLVLYESLYWFAKYFVSGIISGDYKPELVFLVFQVGCLIAVSLNLLYLKADVRAVFSNVTENKGTLRFLYLLKAVAFAIAVFTLTTNLSSLERVALSKGSDSLYSIYKDGMFLSTSDKQWSMEESDKRESLEESLWDTLYKEYYEIIRPIVFIPIAEEKHLFIIMNHFAEPLLPDSILTELERKKKTQKDVIIIHPNDYKVINEDIKGLLRLYLDNMDAIEWKTMEYNTNIHVPYVSMNQLTGFSEEKNPILIYCSENVDLNSFIFGNSQNVIYDMTENTLERLDKELEVSKQGFRFISTNMGKLYKYQMNFIRQLIQFLSSLCILVVFLDFAITITLCNMRYRIFGTEYAIKKVVGYSFWENYKGQFFKQNGINGMLVFVLVVLGTITKVYEPFTCFLVGLAVILIETMVMVSSIFRIEKTSVRKVLKGGCL